jgi:hypothetical protein
MPLAPLSRRRKANPSTVLGELVQTTSGKWITHPPTLSQRAQWYCIASSRRATAVGAMPTHHGHAHQHSARAAIPVQETQRDRAQSSPARRSGSNYGWGAGAKPDGVVAVTLGVATLVSGTGGGVVVVTVCSVACGATAPTTCAGSTELTSPKMTPSPPMATTALAPMTADNNLTRFC